MLEDKIRACRSTRTYSCLRETLQGEYHIRGGHNMVGEQLKRKDGLLGPIPFHEAEKHPSSHCEGGQGDDDWMVPRIFLAASVKNEQRAQDRDA